MSWREPRKSEPIRAFALILPLALGGCFQPLYGPLASGGSLESELQAIAINPILPERLGHYLEGELGFAFNGTGSTVPPKYRLSVTLRERAQAPVIDTVSARATAATIVVDADYILIPVAGGEPITKGTAFSVATYDRTSQRISNVQAARDAETRNAKVIADAIRTRIAAALASRG
jgi:LPS-assembly lipoprotein